MTCELVADQPSAATTRLPGLYAICIICAAAVVLSLPMLIYGPYPKAHDVYEHLTYNRHFSEQLWAGEWYPRWLIGINHGLGSPTFFVFPPFQAYIYAFLYPLSRTLHLDAFVAEEFLVLVASGVCAFVWLHTFAKRRIAIAGAVFYMLVPYHLAVDFYLRNALPECWALAWIPLLLYCTTKIMDRTRGAMVSFAVVYALLILSHLVSVLIFSPIPLIAALSLARKGYTLRSVRGIVEGMFLGTGLSCFYLIPALRYAGDFPPERLLTPPSQYLVPYLIGKQSLLLSPPFFQLVAITALDAIAVCVLCAVAVFVKGRPDSKKVVCFWLAVCMATALMMFSFSYPIWRSLPALLEAVQYPFRLNIILCIAQIAIITVFLSEATRTTRFVSGIGPLVLLVVVPWAISYSMMWGDYLQEGNPRAELASHQDGQFIDDGWFESWTVPGLNQERALRASLGPPVRFTAGTGTATVIVWAPRHIEFATNSSTGGQVMVNQLYYPAWQAALVSSAQPLGTSAAMPEGLIAVSVPPGQEQVRLDIPVAPAEYAGRCISALCVLLCVVLVWRNARTAGDKKSRSADATSG